jgi:hypothetical protein
MVGFFFLLSVEVIDGHETRQPEGKQEGGKASGGKVAWLIPFFVDRDEIFCRGKLCMRHD